jgi:hypothetical protein
MEITIDNLRCYSTMHLTLNFKKWVIVGKHKNEDRPFRIDRLDVHWQPHEDLAYIPPHLSIQGVWAQKGGYKWGTRSNHFPGWHGGGTEGITFETLPPSIKIFIYDTVIKETLTFAGNLAQQLSLLTTNKEFIVNPDTVTATINAGGVFLPSIRPSSLHTPSKWENMDVSRWSVARKEIK